MILLFSNFILLSHLSSCLSYHFVLILILIHPLKDATLTLEVERPRPCNLRPPAGSPAWDHPARLGGQPVACFSPHILAPKNIYMNDIFAFTLSYVSPGVFYCWVSVYIRKKSETESVPVIWRVCESIYKYASGGGLERFPNSVVEFIVGNWAPMLRLLVANWPEVWKEKNQRAHHSHHVWLPISWSHLDNIHALNQERCCKTKISPNLSPDGRSVWGVHLVTTRVTQRPQSLWLSHD